MVSEPKETGRYSQKQPSGFSRVKNLVKCQTDTTCQQGRGALLHRWYEPTLAIQTFNRSLVPVPTVTEKAGVRQAVSRAAEGGGHLPRKF